MFKVIVTKPLRKVKDGGLRQGETLTVYTIIPDHRIGGPYVLYFVVWNEAKQTFMLEPAEQFTPVQK